MSGSRTVPVVIVSADYSSLWGMGAGAVCLLLAFLLRRTLPAWARWVLLTVGIALIMRGFPLWW